MPPLNMLMMLHTKSTSQRLVLSQPDVKREREDAVKEKKEEENEEEKKRRKEGKKRSAPTQVSPQPDE